jgi:hypothetical protein
MQAAAAKAAGLAEACRLLQQPEDLARLHDLASEYTNKLKASKAALSALIASQASTQRVVGVWEGTGRRGFELYPELRMCL